LTDIQNRGIINPGGGKMIEEVKKQISELPKNIRVGQQNKHIAGTHEYNQYVESQKAKGEFGPSRINGDIEFAQGLVDKYSGTGNIILKNGKWVNYEKIESDNIIGVAVNNFTGAEEETTKFKIHYSKYGTHIVPTYLNEKGK
jgi:uncharacterized short protein YbdD (DUF466 family)